MSTNTILMVTALLAMLLSIPGQAQNLSLEIDGQVVAGPGELKRIMFFPAERRFELVSIYEDIRCVRDGEVPAGSSRLILDQLNPEFEPEAEYSIVAPEDGGSIVLEIDAGTGKPVLRLTTTGDQENLVECTRARKAFWASDFDDVFSVAAATPESPFPTGNTLSIPFTVKNETLTTIATNILVDFTWSATDPSGQPVTEVQAPTFTSSADVTTLSEVARRWTIDSLWPGESRTITVEYELDTLVPSNTLISTEVFNLKASDREGSPDAIEVGSPTPVVSEVTTGEG